jgi:hypothetical protein
MSGLHVCPVEVPCLDHTNVEEPSIDTPVPLLTQAVMV